MNYLYKKSLSILSKRVAKFPIQHCSTLEESNSQTKDSLKCWELSPELVVEGLERPIGLASSYDGSVRLFIIEKKGLIRIVEDGTIVESPFLDISGKVGSEGDEQGLLGIAFHPNYSNNGYFFVNYTDRDGNTVVSRFRVSDENPNEADLTGETTILSILQPEVFHNGGHLAFGPHGYLYISTGDSARSWPAQDPIVY